MAESRRVGLVAPLPPQVGGVASVAAWLLAHQEEIGCAYRTFDLWRPSTDEVGGRFGVAPVARQLRLLARFARWVPSAPPLVHYSVAVTPTGLTRDLLYLALLRSTGRRTIAHVHVVAEESAAWRCAMRAVARLTAERVVASPAAAAVMERIGVPARVVFNPVRLQPDSPAPRPGSPFRVLFVGAYGEHKGCPELLEALSALRAGRADARLTLVGQEMHRGETAMLARRVAELGLEDAVEFAGVVPSESLRSFYETADVFCLPSRSEGLPMALLEAMAFALPVVATPVGGIPDLVRDGETGLVVPPRDAEALAGALRQLADDPGLRSRLGEAARGDVLRLADSSVVAAEWRRIYAEHGA